MSGTHTVLGSEQRDFLQEMGQHVGCVPLCIHIFRCWIAIFQNITFIFGYRKVIPTWGFNFILCRNWDLLSCLSLTFLYSAGCWVWQCSPAGKYMCMCEWDSFIFLVYYFIFFYPTPADSVLLRDVQVLSLYRDRYTTARRSSPVPQLQCVGGSAGCQTYVPEVVQCQNKGWDGVDVQVRMEVTVGS